MATGKRLARDQANEKIAQLTELDGDHLTQALADAAQWLDNLPRRRREAAMDVFLAPGQVKAGHLFAGMLMHSMERHNSDLTHLTHTDEETNWPRLAADGGLHEAWYGLCVKNAGTTLTGPQLEKLRDLLASSIELASGLVARGQVNTKNLGVIEAELGELWIWTAQQWNADRPMILVAPARDMGRGFKNLMELGVLNESQLVGLDERFCEVIRQVADLKGAPENGGPTLVRTRLNSTFGHQDKSDDPGLGGPLLRL